MATLAFDALAQLKPALTQDRDEPGRNPWSQSIAYQQNATNCADFPNLCVAVFDSVPAGKRLVITYASVRFIVDSTANQTPIVELESFLSLPDTAISLPAPQSSSDNRMYTTASPILYFVEAGGPPRIRVLASNLSEFSGLRAALVGYFVNLP